MRKTFFTVVLVLLALQAAAMLVIWGAPAQRVQRSHTPTPEPRLPSATPAPTATRIAIPPLATLPAASDRSQPVSLTVGECRVEALDLIGAWVQANKPEKEDFPFKSLDGKDCTASFAADVLPLFTQPNIWYGGAIACSACHNADLANASAQMDLSSYAGILAGSRRADASAQGQDILGSGAGWEKSKLYQMIFTRAMPMGRPASSPQKGPVITVGKLKSK